tara:strand:+ start:452 stop:874 length:423 start_codon:yes stop_codon:yes gene_type:complete
MLGGGNPVAGSNPVGIGQNVNYIRTKDKTLVYGYSGAILLNNDTQTMLKFNTGANALHVRIRLTGGFGFMDSNKKTRLGVKLDDQEISNNAHLFNSAAGFNDMDDLEVIIAPFTDVEVFATTDNTSGINYYATLTGEAYA